MPRGPSIGFQCAEDFQRSVTAAVKQRGMTLADVFVPLGEWWLRDPSVLTMALGSGDQSEVPLRLTPRERDAIRFIRRAGKGKHPVMEQEAVQNFLRWVDIMQKEQD